MEKRMKKILVLALALACVGVHATEVLPSGRWEEAWQASGAIASPHDEDAVKMTLFTAAAVNNHAALVEGWRAAETMNAVNIFGEMAEAYREALHGSGERHQALLLNATQRARLLIDEWDRDRLAKPMLRTVIAGYWQKEQDVERLKAGIAVDEINRMPAAAHFLCDWITARQETAGDLSPAVTAILDHVMENIHKFSPHERLRLLARLAPFLKSTAWAERLAEESAAIEETGNVEILLNVSRIDAGLGNVEKANERLARAEALIEAGKTGDCRAPWAMLAEAKIAAGRSHDEIVRTFETGMARASDRPGYHKAVAEALTLAAWAQYEDKPCRATPTR